MATLKSATITKDLRFKFGKSLAKGEQVFIKTERVGQPEVEQHTAMRKPEDTIQFGISAENFTFN